jgi:hypothetical protein
MTFSDIFEKNSLLIAAFINVISGLLYKYTTPGGRLRIVTGSKIFFVG